MGLPLQSFSSIQGMDTRQAIYKKAIFGGDRRRGTPVDKIRNFEEKKF